MKNDKQEGSTFLNRIVTAIRWLWAGSDDKSPWKHIKRIYYVVFLVGILVGLNKWAQAKWWPPPPPPALPPKAVFVVLPDISEETLAHLGEQRDRDVSVALDLLTGIWQGASPRGRSSFLEIGSDGKPKVDVQVIPIRDGPEARDTIVRIKERRKEYECLLVLGHETSTLAKLVWREYYSVEETQLPVILLGPTTPTITQDDSARANVLLRLLPNDDKQAERIEDIVGGEYTGERIMATPRNAIIVSDRDNPVYASYITGKLLLAEDNRVRYCGTIEVSTTNSMLSNIERVHRLQPDVIVFVGMTQAAQAFVAGLEQERVISEESRELAPLSGQPAHEGSAEKATIGGGNPKQIEPVASWYSRVELVFSDGCASSGFRSFVCDKERRAKWKRIYLVSTMPLSNGGEKEVSPGIQKRFDFTAVGKAAILLANNILIDAYVEGDLNAIGVLKQLRLKRGAPEFGPCDSAHVCSGNSYLPQGVDKFKFDKNGDNVKWHWRVYRKDGDKDDFKFVADRLRN